MTARGTWRERRRPVATGPGTAPTRDLSMARGRTKTIQLIHVGAGQLGLIDPALPAGDPERDVLYRALIAEVTGGAARSCSDCTEAQLSAVLAALQHQGFRIEPAQRHGRRPANLTVGDMRSKVEALLTSMGLSWRYAESIVCRQRGLPKSVACPISATTATELRYLIAALSLEQSKRESLAAVDRALAVRGLSREDITSHLGLRTGWERRVKDLQQAMHHLDQSSADV